VFNVLFDTTKGKLVIECHHDWAPNGTDRFYELVKIGFFTDMRIFRVVQGFVAQFGISGDPKVSRKWEDSNIPDDSVKQSNTPGMVTFAAGGSPNSRSTQLFINYGDNSRLDSGGFAPIGKVIHGMDVANQFYAGYGESITNLQEQIQMQGNAFLDQQFPKLDSIKRAAFITFNETGSPAPEQLDQNGNRPKP
jgi:peptidyl-prolyl cis-trans isomerase A (cyclophilin A)